MRSAGDSAFQNLRSASASSAQLRQSVPVMCRCFCSMERILALGIGKRRKSLHSPASALDWTRSHSDDRLRFVQMQVVISRHLARAIPLPLYIGPNRNLFHSGDGFIYIFDCFIHSLSTPAPIDPRNYHLQIAQLVPSSSKTETAEANLQDDACLNRV